MASAKPPSESLQAIPTTVTVSQHRHQNVAKEGHEGVDAWLQALGAFLIYTATCAYGLYESFYETTLLSSTPSTTISWVGTLQGVILILGGVIMGPIFDRGYIRELLIIGTITTVLGVMMLSLAREYYQILLAQGVYISMGSAILYMPSISLVALRFQQRRPLAIFIATTSTAFAQAQPPMGNSSSRLRDTR
ncbi:hypothetical protein GB937_008801 [Aspergillus fischeri]|nr:hypothetical protein GB937_008801 [Aspergillus fischeri]